VPQSRNCFYFVLKTKQNRKNDLKQFLEKRHFSVATYPDTIVRMVAAQEKVNDRNRF
jgi:hypothetical protein